MLALAEDGRVFSWGCNDWGQLGLGADQPTFLSQLYDHHMPMPVQGSPPSLEMWHLPHSNCDLRVILRRNLLLCVNCSFIKIAKHHRSVILAFIWASMGMGQMHPIQTLGQGDIIWAAEARGRGICYWRVYYIDMVTNKVEGLIFLISW